MKLVVNTAIILAAFARVAAADTAEFEYESFSRTQTGAAELVLKFHNNSDKTITFIAAECGLLGDNGKALTTLSVNAENIAPGDFAYAKNYGPQGLPVKKADCRIRDVEYK